MFNELTLRLFTQSEPMVKEYAAECLSKLNIGGKKPAFAKTVQTHRLQRGHKDTKISSSAFMPCVQTA